MKIRLLGYKSRYIAALSIGVSRGNVIKVSKEIGEQLLNQNTKERTVWEEATPKKTKKEDN